MSTRPTLSRMRERRPASDGGGGLKLEGEDPTPRGVRPGVSVPAYEMIVVPRSWDHPTRLETARHVTALATRFRVALDRRTSSVTELGAWLRQHHRRCELDPRRAARPSRTMTMSDPRTHTETCHSIRASALGRDGT